jgi:hypothetical protein
MNEVHVGATPDLVPPDAPLSIPADTLPPRGEDSADDDTGCGADDPDPRTVHRARLFPKAELLELRL